MKTAILLIASLGGQAEVAPNGDVTGVTLRGSWVTDSDLKQIAALPKLARLDLALTRIGDHGLKNLGAAAGLRELNLYYAEQITDEGVAGIKGLRELRILNLRGTKITDTTLEHLAGMTKLESLDIGFAQVGDSGLERLAGLENLRELTIGGNKLTDIGLLPLRQLPRLAYLDIGGRQRTDSGLWFMGLTDRGIETLTTLKQLRELRLGDLKCSRAGLDRLSQMAGLKVRRLER